jgi:CheY-like chemotaxis protein
MSEEGLAMGAWDFLAGGREMGALIRATDWARTPLGSPEQWPDILRTTLAVALETLFPTAILWGPELRLLYNDEYRELLGSRHPQALGQPAEECWPEAWDVVGPLLLGVLSGRGASLLRDWPLELKRQGLLEETYFTCSFSPIPDGTRTAGVLTMCYEVTDKVINERRLRTLTATLPPGNPPAPAEAAPSAAEGQRKEQTLQGKRVLLVDDDIDTAQTLAALFAVKGMSVALAYSGKEAIAKAAEFEPELVLLDLGLPDMDGYALAARLCATVAARPIIMALTGYGHSEARERSRRAGLDGHLVKPVDPDAAVQEMAQKLAARRTQPA